MLSQTLAGCLYAALAALIAAPRPAPAQDLFRLPRAKQDSLAKKNAKAKVDSLARAAKADDASTIAGAPDAAGSDSGKGQVTGYVAEEVTGDTAAGDDTVAYAATRIRYRNDRFSLSDKALLTYKGSSLMADSIVYYSKDDIVEAMGAPLIRDPVNPPILGYKMRYNLKTKVGEVYYGSSTKGTQSFSGVEVRRQKNGAVYIARGEFSTCDLPDKHYYFYSRRMILEPKSKVLSGPIVMNIADVPVAVLPMMVMPLGTGRRSGLLQPKFGGDQTQGFYLTGLGYYWAINEYMDLATSADIVEGQSGTFDNTNLDGTFRFNKRYVLNGSVGGKYYLKEFDPGNAGWSTDYTADWNITPDLKQTLKGSGRFQSDPTVVDENALNIQEKSQQTANATLGYRRVFNWNQAALNVDANQNYNLTDGNIDRSIPNATFSVGGPLFPKSADEEGGELLSSEEPWWRKLTWSYNDAFNVNDVHRPALGAARADDNTYVGYRDGASLQGKFALGPYINLTPSVSASQLWSANARGDSAHPVVSAWDPATERYGEYFFAYNTGITADTRIYGIAQPEGKPWFGKLAGIRHTVVPTLGFTYAPKLDSNPRFVANPKLGGSAFQSEQKAVTVSLGNDVDVKLAPDSAGVAPAPGAAPGGATGAKPQPYKVLSATSSANYNFANKTREWSPITSSFSIYLTRNVAFTLLATHALYDDFGGAEKDKLTSPILTNYSFGWRKGIQVGGNFNSGLRVQDTQGFPTSQFGQSPWSADVNYSFNFGAARVGGDDAATPLENLVGTAGTFQRTRTHSATGGLKLNPTAGWQMSYETEYNFSQGQFSQHTFSFHRILHCWQMDFRWSPVGLTSGWNFNIRITDLPDVKLESSDLRSRRLRK